MSVQYQENEYFLNTILNNDDIVYANISPKKEFWIEGIVEECACPDKYKVKFVEADDVILDVNISIFDSDNIAIKSYEKVISIGVCVVALEIVNTNNYLRKGIVLESPSHTNKSRYLIIFDSGTCSYIEKFHVYPIVSNLVKQNFTQLISNPSTKHFVEGYMLHYPERKMLRLKIGQHVNIQFSSQWHKTRVVQLDCSLVLLYIYAFNKYSWIYRGAHILEPIYMDLMTPVNIVDNPFHRRRHNTLQFRNDIQHPDNAAFIEYSYIDLESPTPTPSICNNSNNTENIFSLFSNRSTCYSNYKNLTNDTFDCTEQCRFMYINLEKKAKFFFRDGKSYSDMAKPFLCGWDRIPSSTTGFIYVTPQCQNKDHRRVKLTKMETILNFLKTVLNTESMLGIDDFSLEPISPIIEPITKHPYYELCNMLNQNTSNTTLFSLLNDLSFGKERKCIPCIIETDKRSGVITSPITFTYEVRRKPAPGVVINTDPAFTPGCNCLDEYCSDPSVCSCQQYTLQVASCKGIDEYAEDEEEQDDGVLNKINGHTSQHNAEQNDSHKSKRKCAKNKENAQNMVERDNDQDDLDVYSHLYKNKRLFYRNPTGIYECNENCACSKTHCFNRVAQHGVGGMRFQVFRDRDKGWCARTLDDIPKGAFVSTYVGMILGESMLSLENDEYFTDLDFIECVENAYEYKLGKGLESLAINSPNNQYCETRKNKEVGSSLPNIFLFENTDIIDITEDDDDIHESITVCNNRQSENIFSLFDKNATNSSNKTSISLSVVKSTDKSCKHKPLTTRQMCSNQSEMYVIDARSHGNIGRFFSHACEPNMFAQNIFIDTHNPCFPWVAFFASENIPAMTELTWDYNYEIDSTSKAIICKCGSQNCRGRLL